jgi:hypothetical protein
MDTSFARAAARVINLSPKTQNRKSKSKPQRAKAPRTAPDRGGHFAAAGVLAVALILLGLFLSHLAAGIALVTCAGPSDGWLMAIGIDLGFIALELAVLASPADKRAAVVRYAAPAGAFTSADNPGLHSWSRNKRGCLMLTKPTVPQDISWSVGGEHLKHLRDIDSKLVNETMVLSQAAFISVIFRSLCAAIWPSKGLLN